MNNHIDNITSTKQQFHEHNHVQSKNKLIPHDTPMVSTTPYKSTTTTPYNKYGLCQHSMDFIKQLNDTYFTLLNDTMVNIMIDNNDFGETNKKPTYIKKPLIDVFINMVTKLYYVDHCLTIKTLNNISYNQQQWFEYMTNDTKTIYTSLINGYTMWYTNHYIKPTQSKLTYDMVKHLMLHK